MLLEFNSSKASLFAAFVSGVFEDEDALLLRNESLFVLWYSWNCVEKGCILLHSSLQINVNSNILLE